MHPGCSMCRFLVSISLVLATAIAAAGDLHAQSSEIVSEHIRMGIPGERQWLGRDVISDLERFWKYVDGATGSMPRRVVIVVNWDLRSNSTAPQENRITLGLNQPASGPDLRTFVFKQGARELARLGLLKLARQSVPVEGTQFLIDGMAEILVHEFDRSTRMLGGAWIIANLLDRAGLLGFGQQSDWISYSQGRVNLHTAAPGITLVMTCREMFGREKTMKLFEALRSGNLESGLLSTFRSTSAGLEAAWLKKVRGQSEWQDVTITSEDDAPALERTSLVPATANPGKTVRLYLFVRDRTNDLPQESVFVQERASGKVYPGKAAPDGSVYLDIPIEGERQPGSYSYRVTAVDDSGNVRNWTGEYAVASATAGPAPTR